MKIQIIVKKIIIKIFNTTIDKNLLIFWMKNFKIKLQELKAPVIINGFFKLRLLTVNNINGPYKSLTVTVGITAMTFTLFLVQS